MTFAQYSQWINSGRRTLQQEAGALDLLFELDPTSRISPPPWRMEWIVAFSDGKYIRLCENYYRAKVLKGDGYRAQFSFHYGAMPSKKDLRGLPEYHHSEPVDLRIDLLKSAHLHYLGPDHIDQSQISGLNIATYDLFDFLEKVKEHRATGRPLNETFGFTVL